MPNPRAFSQIFRGRKPVAFTLLEMLIATAASVLLLGSVMSLFSVLSDAMNNDRSLLQLDAQMRSVRSALLSDLQGYTVKPFRQRNTNAGDFVYLMPVNAATGNGYFEYIEGPNTDCLLFEDQSDNYKPYVSPWYDKAQLGNASPIAGPRSDSDDRIVGDTDDVLMFTTQSFSTPFAGRLAGQQVESEYAEIAWFCVPTPGTANPVTYTLYRRQLLVMGAVNAEPFLSRQQRLQFDNEAGLDFDNSWSKYFEFSDVSCRRQSLGVGANKTYYLFVNSLSDLTKRENRFLHDTPNAVLAGKLNRATLRQPPGSQAPVYPYYSRVGRSWGESIFDPASSPRSGDDVMMTGVLSFDVRAIDPNPVFKLVDGAVALTPSDPGYWTFGPSPTSTWFSDGAPAMPADLGYRRTRGTASAISAHNSSKAYLIGGNDALALADPNGLFDDVFDTYCDTYPGTVAPRAMLMGLQITIRVLDPSTKRVRQLTSQWFPD